MSAFTTMTLTNDDLGVDFLIHFSETPARFNNAGHGKGFARYLHRAGAEQPNARTHLNRRWRKDGTSCSADHRTPEGAESMANLVEMFSDQWQDLHNDLCYIEAAEGPAMITDDQMREMYSYLWSLTEVGGAMGVMVTHHDQNSPVHIHHVRHRNTPSLYEALKRAGVVS